jgi:zinc/manganese transport system ATP-binding protein
MPSLPPASGDDDVLSVDNVSVELGGHTILDRVSFTASTGSFTGLIGANGAGKTTLLRVILGLVPPSSGSIHIGVGDRSRRKPMVGYVPQKIALEPDIPMRARDLVGLGIDGHRFGVTRPSAAHKELIDEMLDAVNAISFAYRRVGELSGGEQQRVMIAHALISRPHLLLLDEPLANLDITSSHEVVELLARIATEHGVAVLLSAHDMNPLLPVMDRTIYLVDGRAASGPTEEVVRSDTLSEIYGQAVEVIRVGERVLVVAGQSAPTVLLGDPAALAGPGGH